MLRFVVTGAPRSGTMWTAKALTDSGLPCAHETYCSRWGPGYEDDTIWQHANYLGESSPQAGAFVDTMSDAGVVIVRVMRHPLPTVASILARGIVGASKPIEHFYRHHAPAAWERWDKWEDLPDVVLAFWIEWNRRIAESADLLWKTPATRKNVHDLADLIDMKAHTQHLSTIPPANVGDHTTNVGQHMFTPALWDEAMGLWEG